MNDESIFGAKDLNIWFKIFSAVEFFLLIFFMCGIASNIGVSVTQFYCFN